MIRYQIAISPYVATQTIHLPPAVKRDAKHALRVLADAPHAGEPLRWELEGLWKYRIRSFRIVYQIVAPRRLLQVMAIGHRDTVYDFVRMIYRRVPGTRT